MHHRSSAKNSDKRLQLVVFSGKDYSGASLCVSVPQTTESTTGKKKFELTNHLALIGDRKQKSQQSTQHQAPEVVNLKDDYPFGMVMPGRSYTADVYRYGFQGQEEDDELWGGAVSYKYRVEDPRLGRFFSVDPLAPKYPHNSPYAFSENRLIDGVELEGLEFIDYWSAHIRINNYGAVVIRVPTMSETYQETWDALLTAQGYPPLEMKDEDFLASREVEKFQVIPEELLTRPSLMVNGLKNGFIKNGSKENYRWTQKGRLDRRYNSTKRINSNARMAKGLLVIETIGLVGEGIQGWGAMFDMIALNGDEQILEEQFELFNKAILAINDFTSSNEIKKDLLEGQNLVNLINYVLYGEMAGENKEVFDLGDQILNSVNKNDKIKVQKPKGNG